jgi:hypothetical protein
MNSYPPLFALAELASLVAGTTITRVRSVVAGAARDIHAERTVVTCLA